MFDLSSFMCARPPDRPRPSRNISDASTHSHMRIPQIFSQQQRLLDGGTRRHLSLRKIIENVVDRFGEIHWAAHLHFTRAQRILSIKCENAQKLSHRF